jgi:hypothetical protein
MGTLLGYTNKQLARLQVELEYDLTKDGLLVPIEGSDERNLCSLYVSESGVEAFFRFDVPACVRLRLVEIEPADVSATADSVSDAVGARAVRRSETYVAEAPLPPRPSARPRFVDGRFVVDAPDGRPASWAWSVREGEHAAECAVETVEPFRRKGFASTVAAAWMNAMLAARKVPFYSHAASNDASRALAARLGLTHVFTVFAVE